MHSHDHSAESKHHDHGHFHDHDHAGPHSQKDSVWNLIAESLHLPGHGHSHDRPAHNDPLYNNELGIRTVKGALVVLGVTTALQIAIYLMSGSVALLADTVHNLGDALNSVPLWIAFVLGRRAANKRYTYGYGRAEDVAGLLIVASIGFSAAYILWESVQKFIRPEPLTNLPWVAAASIIGFIGNELVALLQIRVGRRIGSEAMITDGRHARADGLTSLAVLIAVAGAVIGIPILDPIIGIVIGLAIVFITREAIVAIWYRMMDAVEPSLIERGEAVVRQHPQVKEVQQIRMRWVGHGLHIDLNLAFSSHLSMQDIDDIIDEVGHQLFHEISNVAEVRVAPVCWESGEVNRERKTAHHIVTG